MLGRIRPHLNHATVVAYLALFVALGGTGFAATHLSGRDTANAAKKHKKKHPAAKCASLCPATLQSLTTKMDSEIARLAPTLTVAHAGSADTATNSGHATNADHAVNADALGGQAPGAFKIRCPSDTVLAAAACVETTTRTATDFGSAAVACQVAGRRLPSFGEVIAFGYVHPIPSNGGEWSNADYYAVTSMGGSPMYSTMIYEGSQGGYGYVSATESSSHPYRCVTGPSN